MKLIGKRMLLNLMARERAKAIMAVCGKCVAMPDRPLHNFRALRSGHWAIL